MTNELAVWLKNRAEHAEAEPLFRRALAIDEKSFGPDHPNVANPLYNLAGLLTDTNRHAQAEPLMRRGLEILLKFTNSTGHLHPHFRQCSATIVGALLKNSMAQKLVKGHCRPALKS